MRDIKADYTVAIWIAFAIITSVIPHPPNCSALLPAAFIIGIYFNPLRAIICSLVVGGTVNFLLFYFNDYCVTSHWLFFSLSGITAVTLMGFGSAITCERIVQFSLIYWLWTNLYVWLYSSMYPLSVQGLLTCYVAAIPFLNYSLIGNILWLYLLPITYMRIVNGKSFVKQLKRRKI